MADADPLVSTAAERALIRLTILVGFGQEPHITDGVWLPIWWIGPLAGQPKVLPAVDGIQAECEWRDRCR